MAQIEPMTKDKVVRPSLIDSVDKINEIVTAVNLLDPAEIESLDTRVSTLETSLAGISTRIDGIANSISTINSTLTTHQTDIDRIKTTLYTPLEDGGN